MAARRKRVPEPDVIKFAPAEAVVVDAAEVSNRTILRCTPAQGVATDIETTMAALTSEGVEVPEYTRRVTLIA